VAMGPLTAAPFLSHTLGVELELFFYFLAGFFGDYEQL